MGFFGALVVWASMVIISAWMRHYNKPPNAEKQGFAQESIPQASEGSSLPLVLGRNRMAPNVLWYWLKNGGARPIQEDGRIVAYKYGGYFHMGLCLYPSFCDVWLFRHWLGEKVLVYADDQTYVTAGTPTAQQLDDGNDTDEGLDFFGGKGKGGSVEGFRYWYTGGATQSKVAIYDDWEESPEFAASGLETGLIPAYRGFVTVFLDSYFFGESPQLPPVTIETEVRTTFSGINNHVGDGYFGDVNPAAAIYLILTDLWAGLGISTNYVDIPSFEEASNTLNDEDFGIACVIAGQDAKEAIDEILRHIDGVIFQDHSSGKLKIKLIRNDYSVGSLFQLDASNVVSVDQYATQTWAETYNRVRVKYQDRDRGYKEAIATKQDLSNYTLQVKLRVADFEYPWIKRLSVAMTVAERELRAVSIPRRMLKVVCNREAILLRPGDAFKFDWPEYGISDMVFRVRTIDLGTLSDNKVTIEAMQDVWDASGSSATTHPTSSLPLPPPPRGVYMPTLEAPSWLKERLKDLGLIGSNTTRHNSNLIHLVGAIPIVTGENFIAPTGAIIEAQETGSENVRTRRIDVAVNQTATVETDYPRTTDSYDTSVGLRITNVSDLDFLVARTEEEIETIGRNLIYVNGEFMAFESVTDEGDGVYTLNNVWRELLDTSPKDHVEGDLIIFCDPNEPLAVDPGYYDGDEELTVTSYSTTGLSTSEDATIGVLQLEKRSLLPYAPQNLQVRPDDQDPNAKPSFARDLTDPVTAPEVDFQWAQRNRTSSIIQRGDAVTESPESGTLYELQGKFQYDDTWTALRTAIAAGTSSQAWTGPSLGFGPHELRVSTYRDIDPGAATDTRYSFDGPAVLFELAPFRQLLKSPNGNNQSEGWTVTAGAVDFNRTPAIGTTYGQVGTCIKDSGTAVGSTFTMNQVVDVADLYPVGKDAELIFHVRNDNNDTDDTCIVTLAALDASNSVLTSANTGTFIPANSSWARTTLSLSNMPYGTTKLKVTVTATSVGGLDNNGASPLFKKFDLRCGYLSTNQISNGTFTTNTTGWTASGSAWTVASSRSGLVTAAATGNFVHPPDEAAPTLRQDISVPAGFTGSCYVKWMQGNSDSALDCTGKVRLEARTTGGTVLLTVDSAAANPDAQDTWRAREMAMTLPTGTDLVRIYLMGARNSGTVCDVAFDDIEIFFEKPRIRHVRTAAQVEERMGVDAPSHLWLFQQDSGATTAVDTIGAVTLTAASTPTFGTANTTLETRAVILSDSSSDKLAAAANTTFNIGADESFAVYVEGVINESSGELALVSKASGTGGDTLEAIGGTGWRIGLSGSFLVFEVGDGTTYRMITSDNTMTTGFFRGLFVYQANVGMAMFTSLDDDDAQENAVSFDFDGITIGSLANSGVLTVGANTYLSSLGSAVSQAILWRGDAVDSLFEGSLDEDAVDDTSGQIQDLECPALEALDLSKGW